MWHDQISTLHSVPLPVPHHVITVNARQQGSFCQTRLHLDWFGMLTAAHKRVVARCLSVNCHSSHLLGHRRHASIVSHRCGSVYYVRGVPDCAAHCSGSECSSRIWILEWCRYSYRYLCMYVEICQLTHVLFNMKMLAGSNKVMTCACAWKHMVDSHDACYALLQTCWHANLHCIL